MKRDHIALCCISLAWFLILSGRYSISNLLPKITQDLNFSWTEAGIAMTSMWLFYALLQFPSGIFSDIKGRKISIILAMVVFSISYFLVGFSIHFFMFFLALILLGAGTGGYPSVGISMITDIFKEKRGKALGIRSSAGSLAYIVPMIAAVIASYYDWRSFFFIWSGISLISIYLFYRGTQESTQLPKTVSVKERVVDGISIFKKPQIQLMFVVNLLIAITWISYMSFFQPYLIVGKEGFNGFLAGIALGILGIGGFIFKPFIGSLSDRIDKKIIILILSVTTGLATLALVFSNSIIIIFLICPALSLSTAIFPVISSFLMDQWDDKGRAGKLGFYRSMLILLASPSSSVIGYLADRYSFDVPFIGLAIIFFIAAIVILVSLALNYKKNKNLN
ncbi:MAG: MFS transporter [Candidatus Thermoplasmatota archaeon]|nr:MFS transporter [Candidatus Thermoplasmatota archaeon]